MRRFTYALLLIIATAPSAAGQTKLSSAPLTRLTAPVAIDRSAPARPVMKPSSGRRDALWNGIAIGAAVGVLAAFTSAAEAPADGKVAIIVGAAFVGGCIDARLDSNARPATRTPRPGRHLAVVSYSIRF
jgi:hypothetical protein